MLAINGAIPKLGFEALANGHVLNQVMMQPCMGSASWQVNHRF